MKSVFAQLVQGVERSHRKLGVGSVDQDANLYLRRGYGENVDPFLAQGLEHLCRDAGVAAHADADHGNLGNVAGALDVEGPDLLFDGLQNSQGPVELGLLHREGDIGELAVGGQVLDDHIDVDVGGCQRAEDAGGHAGL